MGEVVVLQGIANLPRVLILDTLNSYPEIRDCCIVLIVIAYTGYVNLSSNTPRQEMVVSADS